MIKKVLLTLFSSVLFILAMANIASATGVQGFQPEVPKALRK